MTIFNRNSIEIHHRLLVCFPVNTDVTKWAPPGTAAVHCCAPRWGHAAVVTSAADPAGAECCSNRGTTEISESMMCNLSSTSLNEHVSKMMNVESKTRNSASKTRNCVSETRNCALNDELCRWPAFISARVSLFLSGWRGLARRIANCNRNANFCLNFLLKMQR